MDESLRRAAIDAARRISLGQRITVSSRSYWSSHGNPSVDVRQDILDIANAIALASAQAETAGEGTTIADLYSGLGAYGSGDSGGVMGNSSPVVFITVSGDNAEGRTVFRNQRLDLSWGSSLTDFWLQVNDTIADYEASYGFSGGELVSGTTLIY
jgi:hypothetical protein